MVDAKTAKRQVSVSAGVLPGFNLTLGYTLVYLSIIVLVPLAAVFLRTAELSLVEFWDVITEPRVVASYKLSFGASLSAAGINAVFGLMLAWVLVRRTAGARLARRMHLVAAAALLQLTLGIATLLLAVPIALGVAHQGGAALLLCAVLLAWHAEAAR